MLNETFQMIRAIKKMYPVVSFFKRRYFPDGSLYYSNEALIETKKKGRRIAPFVTPLVNGIPMVDDTYRTDRVEAPYIVPKMPITALDLEKKAFGESPDSNRSPEDRASEVQAEHMDDLRRAVIRRLEKMSVDIITNGSIVMRHFSSANDAAKGVNYEEKVLQYYDNTAGFQNKYTLPKDFMSLTARKKVEALYDMISTLRTRGVRATDLVMTNDVSKEILTDPDFLKYFDIRRADLGEIKPEELPEGVVFNGSVNILGVIVSLFTYDEVFEDLDGAEKEFLPKGTIALLHPGLGETAYAQVTFVKDGGFKSYAEPMVPRMVASETNNMMEVQMFSRPVPFPYDWEGWLVANVYDNVTADVDGHASTDESKAVDSGIVYKTTEQINAMTKKADVIAYAESIGLTGLSENSTLVELKEEVLNYQEALQDAGE